MYILFIYLIFYFIEFFYLFIYLFIYYLLFIIYLIFLLDGGFHLIPGSHKRLKKWTTDNKHLEKRFVDRFGYQVPLSEKGFHKSALRVPMKAGSLVVWDQRCFHGSAPNSSD